MTTQEFNLEFDILYNNIMSNVAPGLSSYEKSIFLTQAQEQLVESLYKGDATSNLGFEKDEEMMQSLKELVVDYSANVSNNTVKIPTDLLYIVREVVKQTPTKDSCKDTLEKEVIPVTQDKLTRTLKNPFKGIPSNKVLRVLKGNTIKLYSKEGLSQYTMTYLRRPRPIIIEDLPEEYIDNIDLSNTTTRLTINGISTKTECELNPSLHRRILQLAVQIAKMTWKS